MHTTPSGGGSVHSASRRSGAPPPTMPPAARELLLKPSAQLTNSPGGAKAAKMQSCAACRCPSQPAGSALQRRSAHAAVRSTRSHVTQRPRRRVAVLAAAGSGGDGGSSGSGIDQAAGQRAVEYKVCLHGQCIDALLASRIRAVATALPAFPATGCLHARTVASLPPYSSLTCVHRTP